MKIDIKTILFAIMSIYLITVVERLLSRKDHSSELIIEHAQEKARLKTKIDLLENKIHNYELDIIKIQNDVSDLNNNELDSVWTSVFK